jgi:hypothetical protein
LLSKPPDDTRDGPDVQQHRLLEAFWRFLATVDTNDKCIADAIWGNVKNFPHDVEFVETDFGFPQYGELGYDSRKNIISYLGVIVGPWEPSEADKADAFVVLCKSGIIENVTARIVKHYYFDDK